MDILKFEEFKELMAKRSSPAISIYIPTHVKGQETEQDHIRFKNQLREVEKRLSNTHRQNEIDEMLKQAKSLIDDNDFWLHQEEGLAVFISPGEFFYYRLPEKFEEEIFISDRYYLRPLFSVINGNHRFLLLVLNQKNIRLLECTRYTCTEVNLKNMPVSIDEFLAYEEEDNSLQFHTQTSMQGPAGGRSAVFHGTGGGNDDKIYKEKIHQFFIQVDKGLQPYLSGENAPLLLAGTEYLIPLYKEANSYGNVLEQSLSFNVNSLSDDELKDNAWEIVKMIIDKNFDKAVNMYNNYVSTVRSSDKTEAIVKHAYNGRILYLFIDKNEKVPGRFDKNTYRVELFNSPVGNDGKDNDLIDLAAEKTLMNNGNVFLVDTEKMPCDKPMAAFLRY